MTTVERFWSHVDKTDNCWLWQAGTTNRGGYGRFAVRPRKRVGAHRFSYALAHGVVPPCNRLVLQTCDIPLCVRPDHLVLGTRKDYSRLRTKPE